MNCNNSELYIAKALQEAFKNNELTPITDEYNELLPLPQPVRKNKIRNKPCICGSGIKFKRCCWNKYTQTHQ